MNHPTREQWMAYLYDEGAASERTELIAHLKTCAACQAQLAAWQNTRTRLDDWSLARPGRQPGILRFVKWGIAACLLIAFGVTVGRLTVGAPNVAAVRASLEPQLRRTMEQKLATARDSQRKELIGLLREVEKQRFADYAALRKDLETVAILAEDKLQRTQQEIGQLATFTQTNFKQNQ